MIIRGNYIENLIEQLFKDGMNIVNKAKETKQVKNRSFNLEDAFGCAVYYKGRIVRKGYANTTPKSESVHKGWEKRGIEANTGRGYLDDFFNEYKPTTKGIALVCVNAIFYAPILEDGRVFGGAKYKIITQTDYMFDSLKAKYKGCNVKSLR